MNVDDLDFRALADNIPTLCWIANPDGFIVWYNRRWYEYTGTTPAEMEGSGWQSVHDQAELPRVLAGWQSSIATGAPFEMIFPLRAADGHFRPFLTRVVPTRDADGAVTAWYGVNADISEQTIAERERKVAEARLIKARAEAEHARRAAELARNEAEGASAAKSDFLASMSHEIRTPLNAIIGYTDLLLEENPAVPGLSRRLELIQKSGAALLTVLDDILDFSKIEARQIEIEPAVFSPPVLIDNVTSMLAAFAERKGVRLERTIDANVPPFLHGDDGRLRQIMLNLVNNAIKFTSGNIVRIGLEVADKDESGVSLRFIVSASGIGISAEQQTYLFQRFRQVDGSITRRFGGTGLGLAICKQLVELMGGAIGFDSREGEGPTFWFVIKLSIAEPERVASLAVATASSDWAPGASILLVEDVEVNRDLAKAVLEGWGHRIDIASDGAEAIEKIYAKRYDLVLMDVQMPGTDGMTATKIIRASNHANATIPIIAMTANILPQQIASLIDAGMNDHVGKPFKTSALQEVVGRWATRRFSAGA